MKKMNTIEFIEHGCDNYPESFLPQKVLDKIKSNAGYSEELLIQEQKDKQINHFKNSIMFLEALKTDLLILLLEEYYPALILPRKKIDTTLYMLPNIIKRLMKVNIIPSVVVMKTNAKYAYRYDIKMKEFPDYKKYDIVDNVFADIDNTELLVEHIKLFMDIKNKHDLKREQRRLNKIFHRYRLSTEAVSKVNKFLTGEELSVENFLSCINFIALCAAQQLRESLRNLTIPDIVGNFRFEEYQYYHFEALASICNAKNAVAGDYVQIKWDN